MPDVAAATKIDHIIDEAIAEEVFPGAVVLVAREGRTLFQRAYGHSVLYSSPERRRDDPIPATTETIYDLASLTKVVVTTTAVMQLAEAGTVDLDALAAAYLPALVRPEMRGVTVRHLLTHTSGLPAGRPFYRHLRGRDTIVAASGRVRPLSPPARQVLYSDLNFILLGGLVATVTGLPLEAYARDHIFAPLGMRSALYTPPQDLRPRIAATEFRQDGTLAWSVVHDENTEAMGGISGHAGLFATASDLALFCAALLAGDGDSPARLLRPATLREMFAPQTGDLTPARGLGWITGGSIFMGALAGADTVGHTGFTGTSIVMDRAARLAAILLTNRVHPTRNGPDTGSVRAVVADAARALASDTTRG